MSLFGTAGIRGPVTETVTPELALQVGQAVGKPGRTVVIGRDGRETGSALADALAAGVQAAGCEVHRIGIVPTPALAYASRDSHGAMLTASHNPPADNGIKLFRDGIEYTGQQEEAIEQSVTADQDQVSWTEWGTTRDVDVLAEYRSAVVAYLEDVFGAAPLANLSVVVDCGAGVGSLATPQVLRELGAAVCALNDTVDGHFTARESKPTADSLTALSSVLAEGPADLGLAHDGDADRLVVLGADGDVCHEDTILATVARAYTERATGQDPVVVTTPNASGRIDEVVTESGGRVERAPLGAIHEGVASVEADGGPETAVVFAAEPWKHCHPAFGGWIDGVVSAGVVACLVAATGDLETLCRDVPELPYRKESVACPDDAKADVMGALVEALPATFSDATVSTEHGLRLSFSDGSWTLVRPSGTEPYIRIYAESETVDELLTTVRDQVRETVHSHDG